MTSTRKFDLSTEIPIRLDINPPEFRASINIRRHAMTLLTIACLCVSTQVIRAATTEEIIELIDQGQRYNRSLAASGTADVTISNTSSLSQNSTTKPQTSSHSTAVYFDKNKLKWNDGLVKYACDGKMAYYYVPGEIPKAYIDHGEKILRGLGIRFDPRKQSADPHGVPLKETLKRIREAEEFSAKATEITVDGRLLYELVLTYENNYFRTCRFDPEKGYEAVELTLKYPDERLKRSIVADFVQTPSGQWIPQHRIIKFYKVMEQDQPSTLMATMEFVVDNFKFGPVDPQEFTLEGLGVPKGARVYDKRTPLNLNYKFGEPTVEDETIREMSGDPDVKQVLRDRLEPGKLQSGVEVVNPKTDIAMSTTKGQDAPVAEVEHNPTEASSYVSLYVAIGVIVTLAILGLIIYFAKQRKRGV